MNNTKINKYIHFKPNNNGGAQVACATTQKPEERASCVKAGLTIEDKNVGIFINSIQTCSNDLAKLQASFNKIGSNSINYTINGQSQYDNKFNSKIKEFINFIVTKTKTVNGE